MEHEGIHIEVRAPKKRFEYAPDWTYGAGCVFELSDGDYLSLGSINRLARQVLVNGALAAEPQFRLLFDPITNAWARGAPTNMCRAYRADVFMDDPETRQEITVMRPKRPASGVISVIRGSTWSREVDEGLRFAARQKKRRLREHKEQEWYVRTGPRRFAIEGLPFPYHPVDVVPERRARREDEAPPGALFRL